MAEKFHILVTRRIPNAALNILKERCHVEQWDNDDVMPSKQLVEGIKGKDGIFCLLTDKIDANLLDIAGKQLQVVSTMSVGVDHIDLAACKERAIKVGYTPNILTSATAELTVGLLLATSRRIVEGVQAVKEGTWGTWKGLWMCGPTLEDSTVGFFGLGRIGQTVMERLRPFGVKSFIFKTSNKKTKEFEDIIQARGVGFEELLQKSDFLISCCALTPATTHIFNKEAFQKMKSTSIFINIARGGVVQQDDLIEALQKKEIRAAGIDVTTPEPLPVDSPLLKLDNCVVTPHIGSATETTRTNMAVLAANNLINGLNDMEMEAPYML